MKFCPQCGRDYAVGEVCELDGTALRDKVGSAANVSDEAVVDAGVATDLDDSALGGDELEHTAIATTTLPDDPRLGTLLRETYRLDSVLVRGEAASVYRGAQLPMERVVAVKVLEPERSSDPTYRARFFREAKILGELTHPNIVNFVDAGEGDDGALYIVTEMLDGKNLQVAVPSGGLPFSQVAAIVEEVCGAVGEAHRHGLVHRDIKPSNIMLLETGGGTPQVKVLDFGVAKMLHDSAHLTQAGAFVGTPGFMAPEQYRDRGAVDERADVYAIGALLYYLTSGRPPYRARNPEALILKQTSEPPEPLDYAALGKPEGLRIVLEMALHADPQQRYDSPYALAAAVQECLHTSGAWWDDEGRDTTTTRAPEVGLPHPGPGKDPAPHLTTTEPSKRVPTEFRRMERINSVAMGVTIGAVIAAAIVLVIYFVPSGPEQTRIVEVKPESYVDNSGVAGVTESGIVVGMSAPFSGPMGDLAQAVRLGITARFKEQNALGGVLNRRLHLEVTADGGSPERAAGNVGKLIGQRRVFGFLGNVGDAAVSASLSAVPGTLFFAPVTGDDTLRDATRYPNVFHYRPSIAEETSSLVLHLVNELDVSPRRIAAVMPTTPVGEAGRRGITGTLQQYNLPGDSLIIVEYSPGDVSSAVAELVRQRNRVDAALVVASPVDAEALITAVRDKKVRLPIALTSVSDATYLARSLSPRGPRFVKNVSVSQVVPVLDADLVGVARYRSAFSDHFPNEPQSFGSLEGYLSASLFIEGLTRIEGGLTPMTLRRSLESLQAVDLGVGSNVGFAPGERRASRRVWITTIGPDGRIIPAG